MDADRAVWVLGGGGAYGALQVGQLAALRERGWRPDALVGVSVGALNAAVVALDPEAAPDRLAAVWTALRRGDVLPWSRRPPWRAGGVFGDAGLRALLARAVGDLTFADLAVPLAVLATDARTGAAVVLRHGPLAPALLASSAIPGLLPPVAAGGRHLVDGGAAPLAAVEVAGLVGAGPVVTLRALSSCYLRGALGPVGLWRQRRSAPVVRAGLAGRPTVDLGEGVRHGPHRSLRFTDTARLIALGRAEADRVLAGARTPVGAAA